MTVTGPLASAGIWLDVTETPDVLASILERHGGVKDAVALLGEAGRTGCFDGGRRGRLIVVGNGASAYVAHALWLTALGTRSAPIDVIGLPAGVISSGAFADFRSGDILLAVSSSGELRDLIDAMEQLPPHVRSIAVTAAPSSAIARLADVVTVVPAAPQRSETHTHAFCGAVLMCLLIWASFVGDDRLRAQLESAPSQVARALGLAERWAVETLPGLSTPTATFAFGTGPAWAAALESALVVKEITQLPSEGVETREGATTTMTALVPSHLVLRISGQPRDSLADESERICRERGATVLSMPGTDESPLPLVPITAMPGAVAVATEMAARLGLDPDRPAWTGTYYQTARRQP
jgi:fructoselysine-6-P-deglycase FrlB-like protein